ncbi:MAG: AsmA family protein, partial [Thermodesulfobacteriota bacterium]
GVDLPVIESLMIEAGKIRYHNPSSDTDLKGAIATEPAENGGHRLIIEADGLLLESPLAFRFTGDPLTDLQETGITYQARMTAEMGQSRGEAEGVIHQPLNFQGMDLMVTFQGPDFSTPAALWDDDFPETPPYRIDTQLILENGVWKLRESTASLGESDFTGSVTIDPTVDPLAVTADLDFDVLDVEPLTALFDQPETQPKAPSETPLDASFLTGLNADIQVRADSIVMPKVSVNRGGFHLLLEDGRLRIDPLELKLAGGTVKASATAQPADPGIKGSAVLDFTNIDLSQLDIGGEYAGAVSGRLVLDLPPTQHMDRIWAGLNIQKSRLRYQDSTADTDLTADFQTEIKEGERLFQAAVAGEYEGRSLDLSVGGGAVSDLLDPEKPTPLSASGAVNEQAVQFNADLVRREGAWNLENMDARLADSDLQGDIRVDTGGERPEFAADLTSETLNVERLTAFAKALTDAGRPSKKTAQEGRPESGKDEETDSPKKAEPVELKMLTRFDADIEIQADRIIVPDIPLKDVRIDLDLQDGRLTVSPLKFDLRGGTVTAEVSLDAADDPLSGALDATFEQLDLAEILDPFTDLDSDELGVLSGNLDITLTQNDPTALNQDILFPYLGTLKIEESRFTYVNSSKDTDLTLSVPTLPAGDRELPARITGDGRYRGEPFDLSFRGDPLLDLRESEIPYSLDLEVKSGRTRVRADGHVRPVFDLDDVEITLEIDGENPAHLDPFIGLDLPDMPPYDLRGLLIRSENVWKFQDFKARVGNSDLSGGLRVETSKKRPLLTAELTSRHIDLDELIRPGAETVSERKGDDARLEKPESWLPDKSFNPEPLRGFDATVEYRGEEVKVGNLPIEKVVVEFNLEAERGIFDPLEFRIGGGSVHTLLDFEIDRDTVQGMIESEFRTVDLEQVFNRFDIAEQSFGIIGGRAKYWMEGDSVARLLASADGGSYLLMTGGRLDRLLVNLAGLDAWGILTDFFGGKETVEIECAYADLHSESGVMILETFLVDTEDTLFSVSGSIDFEQESFDLVIRPHPKGLSLFTFRSPLNMTGSFHDPKVFPDRSTLLTRGAFSLGMGLVAGPAALLPLIETGTGGRSGKCRGMIEALE